MNTACRFLRVFGLVVFFSCGVSSSLYAQARNVRTISQFDKLVAYSPMSVVVFYDHSQVNRWFFREIESISRDQRYKDAGLKFILVDANRLTVLDLFDRYGIDQDKLPKVQVFLRTQPMRNAFMTGCFNCDELRAFIERFLGRALTTQINHKRVRRQLAQAPRAYYAADYYNPFYMMPYTNYTPPSDWPEKGPEWIGIEVD